MKIFYKYILLWLLPLFLFSIEDIDSLLDNYKKESALWEKDFDASGFEGLNCDDSDNSTLSFIRRGHDENNFILFIVNFTPIARENYRLGVPVKCLYEEVLNSDASKYGGSNFGNYGGIKAVEIEANYRPYSIEVNVPPLGAVILKPKIRKPRKKKA